MNNRASDAYIQEDWERFTSLDGMTNHWDRPGWTPGRRSYHWLITFEKDKKLQELAAACQEPLRGFEWLDLVPLNWLHLTLQRIAFTDEVTAGEVAAVAAAVQGRLACRPTFTMNVGPLAGSAGAVRFSVGPQELLIDIHSMVRDAIASARQVVRPPAFVDFRPHISIAYSNTASPTAGLAHAISALRHIPQVQVPVERVTLVELKRVGASYQWNTIALATLDAG